MQLNKALEKLTSEQVIQHNSDMNTWFKTPNLEVFTSQLRRFLIHVGITTCNAYFYSNGTPKPIFIEQLKTILTDESYEQNTRVLSALWYVILSCELNPWREMIAFDYLEKKDIEDVIELKNTLLQKNSTAIRYLHPILELEENQLETIKQLAPLPSDISFQLEQHYAYFSKLLTHFSCILPLNIHLMLLTVGLVRGASADEGATEENSGPTAKKAYNRFSYGLQLLDEQDLSALKCLGVLPIILALRKGECVHTASENLHSILTDVKCLATLNKIFLSQEKIQKTLVSDATTSNADDLEAHIQQLLTFQHAILLKKNPSINVEPTISSFLTVIFNTSNDTYSPAKLLHNILYENHISDSFILTKIYIELEALGFKQWLRSLNDFQLLTTLFKSFYDKDSLNKCFIKIYSDKINSLEECCWIIRLLDNKEQAKLLLRNITFDIDKSIENLSRLKKITGDNEREFNLILSLFEKQIISKITEHYNLDLFFEDIRFDNQLKILNISKNTDKNLSFLFAYFGSITYHDPSKFQALIDFFSQGNNDKLVEIMEDFHENKYLKKINFISYEFICALLNHEKIKSTTPSVILSSLKEQFIKLFSEDEDIVILPDKEINSLFSFSVDYLLETNQHNHLITFVEIVDAGMSGINLDLIYQLFEYKNLFSIKNNVFWNHIFKTPKIDINYKTTNNGTLLEIAQRLACGYEELNKQFLEGSLLNRRRPYESSLFAYFNDNKNPIRQIEAILFVSAIINDTHNITKAGPLYEPIRFTQAYVDILFFFAKHYPEPTIFELISKTVNEKIKEANFDSLELKGCCAKLIEICKLNSSRKLNLF